jgi:hypothetical protein
MAFCSISFDPDGKAAAWVLVVHGWLFDNNIQR